MSIALLVKTPMMHLQTQDPYTIKTTYTELRFFITNNCSPDSRTVQQTTSLWHLSSN